MLLIGRLHAVARADQRIGVMDNSYVGMKFGVITKTQAYSVVRYTHAGFPQQNGLELSKNQRQQLEHLGGNVLSEYTPLSQEAVSGWSPEFYPGAYTYKESVRPWKLRTVLTYPSAYRKWENVTLYHREHMIFKYEDEDKLKRYYNDGGRQSYGSNTMAATRKFTNVDADLANLKVDECKTFLAAPLNSSRNHDLNGSRPAPPRCRPRRVEPKRNRRPPTVTLHSHWL